MQVSWLSRCESIEERIVWRVLAVALLLVEILSQAARRLNHDVGWFLYGASRLLDGGALYRDIVDPNLPAIYFLNVPPAWIGQLTSLRPTVVFKAYVIGLALLSLALCSRSLRTALPSISAQARAYFLITLLAVFIPYAGSDFGQREHFFLLLVMPYLLLAQAWSRRIPVSPGLCVLAGFLAGIGLAIKPFFLLLWILVEGYLVLARGVESLWKRRENWGVAVVQFGSLAYIVFAAPDYYRHVLPLTWQVYDAANVRLVSLLSLNATLLCAVALLVLFVIPGGAELREFRRVVALAAVGALGSGLLARKGFGYHFYPAGALSIFFLVIAAWDLSTRVRGMEKRLWRAFLAATAVLALVLWQRSKTPPDDLVDPLIRLTEQHAKGEDIVLYNLGEHPAFPLVNYAPARWASRFSSVWFLSGLYRYHDVRPDGARFPYRRQAEMGSAERYVFEALVSDLVEAAPRLVMIDCRTRLIANLNSFDLIEYLSRDARVAELWRNYRHLTTIHCIQVFKRTGPLATQAGARHKSERCRAGWGKQSCLRAGF